MPSGLSAALNFPASQRPTAPQSSHRTWGRSSAKTHRSAGADSVKPFQMRRRTLFPQSRVKNARER